MKIIILLVCFLSFAGLAYRGAYVSPYNIVSDEVDLTIKPGKCVVEGVSINNDLAGTPTQKALVSTVDFSIQTQTDSLGAYTLVISEDDSSIFLFQHGYEEVVVRYDFKSQHRVTINFTLRPNQKHNTVRKPVIYCYSSTPISVDLQLDFKSQLTFTYPTYESDGWKFNVDESGINYENEQFPYLFWEGETSGLDYKYGSDGTLKGHLIKTDSVVNYFETQLNNYGLNQTEKTDFITFWGPKLQEKEYAIVQFISGKDYANNIAGINVQPSPDAQLRLFMNFTLLDAPIVGLVCEVKEVIPIERSGFTFVEWGGAELPLNKNMLP